ncbi:hypothetical protein BGZ65_011097, partial [Modicella reniformis]
GAIVNDAALWRVSIPITSDEHINLSSIQGKERLHSTDALSKTFEKDISMDVINVIIQEPPPEAGFPTFRLILNIRARQVFTWTTELKSATLSALKRVILPSVPKSELDAIQIAIFHEAPFFPANGIERPTEDHHLRTILHKYAALHTFEVVVDVETPYKHYSDYTVLEGERRYGVPPTERIQPVKSKPLNSSRPET